MMQGLPRLHKMLETTFGKMAFMLYASTHKNKHRKRPNASNNISKIKLAFFGRIDLLSFRILIRKIPTARLRVPKAAPKPYR